MALNREKFDKIRQKIATPSGPEQRRARALVLFDKVLEKLGEEDASPVKGLLFVPGRLQTLGITDHEAAEILDFLREQGILNTENKIAKVDTETVFNKKKGDFIAWMERDPSTAASPVAATADDTTSAPEVLLSGEPDAATGTSLDTSTGDAPGGDSTSEGLDFEIEAAPQTDFAHTPLGEAYIAHSTALKNNSPEAFNNEQEILNWMIERKKSFYDFTERALSNFLLFSKSTSEKDEIIIARLKQRGIILEDTEKKTLFVSPRLSDEGARAKIYLAIHNLEDPDATSATPAAGIFKSFPGVTSAATPAAAPASLDLDISAASAAAPLVEPTSPEAKSSEKIINNLVDGLKTNSWSRLEIYDLLGSNLSFDVAFDFVWEVCNKNLATESDDSTQDEKRYRFNYIPDSPDQEAAFKRELTGLLGQCQDKNTPDGSVPKAAPDTETADAVLNAAPDKKRQRIESVTRLFSALKGSAQKSPSRVAGAIASCFLVLGVGAVMYSGKEMAPKAKPAAEAAGGRAPGAAAPQEQSGEAAKTTVRAYRNAELYRGLDSKKRETVDRLMTSTAEQFMMPYLNTVTIYQNGIPKPINLNEASKKTLFKEMNTDWKTLVAKSFSEGPHDPQGADEITLTDTNSKTYSQVYVRVDEQVAKAFKEIRDVTVVVLKKDSKEPYPEGRLEDIYNDIKKSVTAALNK